MIRKTFVPIALAALGLIAFIATPSSVRAQGAPITVEVKEADAIDQQTPDFTVKGVKDKKWKPKTWIEMETVINVKARDPQVTYLDSLLFKYYILLKAENRESMRILTADINHVNIPVDEEVASVAYISPATLLKITGKKNASKSDIEAWGVEILFNGQLVGGKSSTSKKWWEAANAPPKQEGYILTKKETPFAPLWGDYHLDVDSSRR